MREHAARKVVGGAILVISALALMSCPWPWTRRDKHLRMLEGLGLETELGAATDPEGNPLPDDYNPLGGKRGVFHPLEEVYFAGFDHSAKTQYLVDDLQAGLADLYTSGDDSWAGSQYKNCIGADVDGDGFEEVVVVYYASGTLRLKVIDNDNGLYDEYNKDLITGITGDLPVFPHYQPALAKGDLDGDGSDELILGFAYYAYLVDDRDTDYAVTSKNYPSSRDLYIAAGDLDGDSEDEFIVTYYYGGTAYCDVFDGGFSAPFPSRYEYTLHAANLAFTFEQRVHVAMGDIDGDGFDEIVFHGESYVGKELWSLLAMDDAKHDFAWLDFFTWTYRNDTIWGGALSPALAILDYNGDCIDDIFASVAVFRYKEDGTSGHPFSLNNVNIEMLKYIFSDPVANVWTGDVDGDADNPRKDEIVYLWGGKLWIGGQDALGNYAHQTPLSGASNSYSTLCLANVDDDTPIIEYTGEHELMFSDPTVVAVLACPPYHSGIGQNVSDCGTSFGLSTAQGVEETESTGFAVGFSIGYEYEDPFGMSSVSFKVTVEEAMDWISSSSTEIEKYIAYHGGPDEDKVIFTAVPFDVYHYTVISSPDPAEIGAPMTINVPRDMQTLSVSRTFFNNHNGDCPDIDDEVLSHTIGEVASYPTAADKNALLGGGGLCCQMPIPAVGIGSGSTTVGVRKEEGQGSGIYNDFSVTVESEVGSGGFTVGVSSRFHYGYGYTVTNTDSTCYEGTVGDIPDDSFEPGLAYNFGLFAYPVAPASFGGQKFTVVNYWVE